MIIGATLKAVIAFAISFIFLIIDDLNLPFTGKWHIRDDLFESLRDRLRGQAPKRTSELPALEQNAA